MEPVESKICNRCKKDLPVTEFHRVPKKSKHSSGGWRFICKECDKAYSIAKATRARVRNTAYVLEYWGTHPCVKCGEGRPYVLDFHHRDPSEKFYNMDYCKRNLGLETLKAEIAKCDVLCANCHREVHHFLRQKSS
jgi:hypothetical protein